MFVLAARVWTYWIAVVLMFPAVLITIALIAGYVAKVVRPRYRRP
jgi:hypothetical protein